MLRALDVAAGKVRKQLGESAATLERFQTPIAQATTPSLEALRDYTQATERFEHGDWKGTQQLLEQAIALDPGFAAAYASLGAAYSTRAILRRHPSTSKKASICAIAPPSGSACRSRSAITPAMIMTLKRPFSA